MLLFDKNGRDTISTQLAYYHIIKYYFLKNCVDYCFDFGIFQFFLKKIIIGFLLLHNFSIVII